MSDEPELTYLHRGGKGVDAKRLYEAPYTDWQKIHDDQREQRRLNREMFLAGELARLPKVARPRSERPAYSKPLGTRCRLLRRRAGFRVGFAATSLGMSMSRLQRLEWGAIPLTAVLLWEMSKLYAATLDEFFEGLEEEHEEG